MQETGNFAGIGRLSILRAFRIFVGVKLFSLFGLFAG